MTLFPLEAGYNILKHKRQEESWYHLKGFEQE